MATDDSNVVSLNPTPTLRDLSDKLEKDFNLLKCEFHCAVHTLSDAQSRADDELGAQACTVRNAGVANG